MAWKTTEDPRDQIITVRLTAGEADDLNDLARRQGVSRSDSVRKAVTDAVAWWSRAASTEEDAADADTE